VIGAFADATGRTDEEIRLALTVAAAAAGLIALLRLVNMLDGLDVFRHF